MLASRDTDLQPPFQPLPLTLEPDPDCEQAHETGGYLNYRQDDMVRGHGNQPPWKAAGRLPSTELGLQSLHSTLARMRYFLLVLPEQGSVLSSEHLCSFTLCCECQLLLLELGSQSLHSALARLR